MIIGILKPKGPTSHDIINAIRQITQIKKVGHAGTLDPLASGVLVVAIGRSSTKQLSSIVAKEKEYIAKIRLGATSTTDDAEGEVTMNEIDKPSSTNDVESVLINFEGDIEQVPPIFSAVKVKGKEAYKRARKGEELMMGPRQVNIKNISIKGYNWPILKLEVVTGPGVYIRSLARDIGEELKVGGYLQDLIRTRVGGYSIENSLTIEGFKDHWLDNQKDHLYPQKS